MIFSKIFHHIKLLQHSLGLSITHFSGDDFCCKSKFKNWLTCLYDVFFFRQKFVERKSVKLLYNTLGGKTLISLKKLLRLEKLLDFRHQLVVDPRVARDNFFYDSIIILNIFQCITTQAALYMYDQYIVGFMIIGDFGLGIRCKKFRQWYLKL